VNQLLVIVIHLLIYLVFLLGDESCEVREEAVLNPNTPLNVIEKLHDDESKLVRDAVIWRKRKI